MIAAMSKRRAKQNREYLKLRRAYLCATPYCEACPKIYPGQPIHKAVDIHHAKGRTGSLLTATEFYKAVCRNCHHWIASYPDRARALGLLCEKGEWNTTDKTKHRRRE